MTVLGNDVEMQCLSFHLYQFAVHPAAASSAVHVNCGNPGGDRSSFVKPSDPPRTSGRPSDQRATEAFINNQKSYLLPRCLHRRSPLRTTAAAAAARLAVIGQMRWRRLMDVLHGLTWKNGDVCRWPHGYVCMSFPLLLLLPLLAS